MGVAAAAVVATPIRPPAPKGLLHPTAHQGHQGALPLILLSDVSMATHLFPVPWRRIRMRHYRRPNERNKENPAALRFYLSSLTVKRRSWGRWGHLHRRRARAKIMKLMEKLWVNDNPRVITRRVAKRIGAAIPESAEELLD